jgi:hypothetical protein
MTGERLERKIWEVKGNTSHYLFNEDRNTDLSKIIAPDKFVLHLPTKPISLFRALLAFELLTTTGEYGGLDEESYNRIQKFLSDYVDVPWNPEDKVSFQALRIYTRSYEDSPHGFGGFAKPILTEVDEEGFGPVLFPSKYLVEMNTPRAAGITGPYYDPKAPVKKRSVDFLLEAE